MRKRAADLYEEIQTTLKDILDEELAAGDDDLARRVSERFRDHMIDAWGGAFLYIPKDMGRVLAERNRKIYQAFTGANHFDLALKFGLALQTVYDILKKEGGRIRMKQTSLFDLMEEDENDA